MDRGAMIAEVMKRVDIRLKPDDPVFAVVELNRLALEESVDCTLERLSPIEKRIASAGFEFASQLSTVSIRRIQAEVAAGSKDIAGEAKAATDAAAIAINQIAQSTRSGHAAKWIALGMVLAGIFTAGGVAIGFAWATSGESPPGIHR